MNGGDGRAMGCAEAVGALGPWVDGELDGAAAAALQAHVAGCASCSAERDALAALRREIATQVPRFEAPPGLRERVVAALGEQVAREPSAARDAGDGRDDPALVDARVGPAAHAAAPVAPALRRERRRWFAAGAFAGALLAVAVVALTSALWQRSENADRATAAVDSHVRATLGHRLIEVASSDRHTVKPWLSARLDYAAPVPDAVDPAFVLAGGRLDVLDGRPTATLVYRYREHVVDVFVRPLADAPDGPRVAVVRGFTVARATGAGMEWRAVADVDPQVLAAFVGRLAEAAAPALR